MATATVLKRRWKRNTTGKVSLADIAIRVIFVLLVLALWQWLHYHFVTVKKAANAPDAWSGALFPSPKEVGLAIWDGFGFSYLSHSYEPPPGARMPHTFLEALGQSDYPAAIWLSMWRLFEGYFVSIVIGFPLGLITARSWLADRTIGWVSTSLQGLPSICWIPLAMLWFAGKSDTAPILFVTIMGSLFATVISVADGVRNIPPLYSRAGQTLGAKGARLYWSVLLPSALPSIVTGLKIGWSFAWRSLMAAELIVNAGGLGYLLDRDRGNGDSEKVLASIFIIILLGLGVQAVIFAPIERRLRMLWGLSG